MTQSGTPRPCWWRAVVVAVIASSCRDVVAPVEDPTTVTYAPQLNIRIGDYVRDTSGVYYRDLVKGSGATVIPKSTITYSATGYLADARQIFTTTSGSSLTAVVGNGDVVVGLDRGFLGMNKGGRRRVIIPPALGYGNQSQGTAIPAGSVLIFEVDAQDVSLPAATTSKASS